MDRLSIKRNWNNISGKLKQQDAKLIHDDRLYAEGKEDELLGRLQQKIGKFKEGLRARRFNQIDVESEHKLENKSKGNQ